MFLDDTTFRTVLASTPLVSIDLIVNDRLGRLLLGQRNNRPAKGDWFVPGGRIFKNESIAKAFSRLSQNELGNEFLITDATLLGVFDHFYNDSVFGDTPSTHYVALAYTFQIDSLDNLPKDQHNDYRWFSVEELLADPDVHLHTKAYFSSKD